jgi:hypothetical protein
MRAIFLLALVLDTVVSVPAQGSQDAPDPRIIGQATQLLDSRVNRDRTWGVFLAGQYHFSELLPRLLGFLPLSSSEAAASDAQECFYRSLLDALIRLDADIPPDTLNELYRRYPDESIILFSKSTKDNQAPLFTLFQEQMPTLRWRAIGNLLAEKRATGLAGLLMKQMQEINVRISIWDGSGGIGCGGGSGYGITDREVPEGFPPVALYALSDQPGNASGIVASRPRPIYYQRWVFEPGDKFRLEFPSITWDPHLGDGRDDFRFEYLAMLLQQNLEDVAFDSKPDREIQWTGPTDYFSEVESVCTHVLARYDDLVTRLAAFGLLTQSEAGSLNARVHLRIVNLRENKGIPLPEIGMERVVVEQ